MQAVQATPANGKAAHSLLKKPVVLCVDDERVILESLWDQIHARLGDDCAIELAESGEEALNLIHELKQEGAHIAIVISDHKMPGMKGDEFLIRVHQLLPDTQTILLTGKASINAVLNAISNAQLYRYVTKPWEEHDLMLTIHEAFKSYRRQLELHEHNVLLKALNQAALELSREMELGKLVQILLRHALNNTRAEAAYLITEQGGKPTLRAVLRTYNPVTPPTATEVLQNYAIWQQEHKPDYRLCVPLEQHNRRLGWLMMENPMHRTVFTPNQREVLGMLAKLAASALESAGLVASIHEKSKQLAAAHELLTEQSQDMADSIRYAERIQRAIMPDVFSLQMVFPDSFIFNQPRDVVSGDFYWHLRKGNIFSVAAADCTGHGVPGAFVSLIAISLLAQLVLEDPARDPAALLNELNTRMPHALGQEANAPAFRRDGMDIAFCQFDLKNRTLKYAGARRPLFLIRNRELIEYPGSRIYIGEDPRFTVDTTFQTHEVALEKGDRIYIFTDGFADQFGGPEHRKYAMRRLRQTLVSLHDLPMDMQALHLEKEFNDWKRGKTQTDDTLMVGIHFDL